MKSTSSGYVTSNNHSNVVMMESKRIGDCDNAWLFMKRLSRLVRKVFSRLLSRVTLAAYKLYKWKD